MNLAYLRYAKVKYFILLFTVICTVWPTELDFPNQYQISKYQRKLYDLTVIFYYFIYSRIFMYVYAPGYACAPGIRWLSHHTGAVNRACARAVSTLNS